MKFPYFGTKSCLKMWQKIKINTKNACNFSKYMNNGKMLGHCSTPPRGQGQFHYGNSAGTVSSTGFLKIFAYKFGTKNCLRVLQRLYIINKSTKTCSKCIKNAKTQDTAALPPSARGSSTMGLVWQFHWDHFFL